MTCSHLCARRITGLLFGILGLALHSGCTGSRTRVEPPKLDPDAAGKAALAAYDTNKDGLLSDDELGKCPALDKARALYDKNQDGKVDAGEISARLQIWQAGRTGLMTVGCTVKLDGKPLEGARVELVPEAFLGDVLLTASGTTNRRGMATLAADLSSLPAEQRTISGVQCGLYRIRVTHPSQKIPAAYNTETTLGQEVAVDNYGAAHIDLALKSK